MDMIDNEKLALIISHFGTIQEYYKFVKEWNEVTESIKKKGGQKDE